MPHTVPFISMAHSFCDWKVRPPYFPHLFYSFPYTPLFWQPPACSQYLLFCFCLVLFVHLLFRFNLSVKSYGVCLFLSDLLHLGFACGSAGKESAWNAGDLGSIPGLGRFPWRREKLPIPVFWPGEFHGLVHGVTKSRTWLSNFHFQLILRYMMDINSVTSKHLRFNHCGVRSVNT